MIEEDCLLVILKERPFATDLRRVTGIFKLVEDIERLGDHAEDIAWVSKNLYLAKESYKDPKVEQIISVALSMVNDSYKALASGNAKLAEEVIKRDDIVDKLYLELLNEIPVLKEKYALNDSYVIYTTLLVKYVERIADHASNIAEWTVYIQNGYYKDKVIL